jgi:hypothetical protein
MTTRDITGSDPFPSIDTKETTTVTTTIDRNQLAQETAEYIAAELNPLAERVAQAPGCSIVYPNGQKPPTAVEQIKATLLDGRLWISWMDDRVFAAMRAIHSPETSTRSLPYGPADLGHDGRCDHDGGCQNTATVAVISGSNAACSCGRRCGRIQASLAFLCGGHVAAEPVADIGAAEHRSVDTEGPARAVWGALLAAYPVPVGLPA